MKMSKFFVRIVSVFGLSLVFSISSWADADLSITKTVNNTTPNVGDTISFTIVGRNNGPDSSRITIIDALPSSLQYSSASDNRNNFACSQSNGTVTCTGNSSFSNGSNVTVTINAKVVSAESVTNTAYISSANSVADNDTSNNSASASLISSYPPGLREFSKRSIGGQSSTNIRGNILMVGNQLLCQNSANGETCTEPTVGATNNSINQHFANVDTTTTSSGITNSSMARLDMQAGDTIIWARLYWSARMINPTTTEKEDAHIIKFRTPASTAYQTITAENFDYFPLEDPFDYGASADVTSLVQSAGAGQYYGANIQADTGTNKFASWMLLVVVQNNNRPFNNLSVYDGFQVVFDGDSNYPSEVSATASGFLTPKSGTVTSNLFVYTGESESGIYDGATITNKSGIATSLVDAYNTPTDLFNGSASISGVHRSTYRASDPGLASPNFQNLIGTDLDKLTVTNLNNEQTTTTVTIKSTGGNNSDRYSLNMFALETKLYEPRFCYDYGYEQNGLPFTEENNGTKMPYIVGNLPNTSDINVTIYIRNMENSDVNASNMALSITDINTSQAIYTRNSVSITYPNEFTPTYKTDAAWPLSVSDSHVSNIPIGDMAGDKYAYVYYGLTPLSTGSINLPISGTFSYDLQLTLPDGTILTLPYSSTLGGPGLSMCSSDNFSYTPAWGIFSVVNAGLYDSATANRYYDLTTQVAKRPGNFRVASFEKTALDTPKSVSTAVAVELIDVSQFHDTDAACQEPSSAVSPRIWVTFDNNVSQINFNKDTIAYAITNGMVSDAITGNPVTLANAEDFYKTATPNAAFRVSYNATNDGNQSLIQTAPGTPSTNTQILNFTQLVQDIQHCAQPVEIPSNPGNTTTLVSVACGNAGNQGIDKHNFAICMECLYGYNTTVLCSRDNFAIRPESYTVTLKDINQANHTVTQTFASGHTGVDTPNLAQVDVAGGYDYRFDINATNHIDNANTPGYTRYFGTANSDYNVTFVWEPTTPKSGCNDTLDKPQNLIMLNGTVAAEQNLSQVGEYRLDIIDKRWTAVDWDSALQTHQIGSHFLSDTECTPSSADVPPQATAIGLSGTTITNKVGCDTSSIHDNVDNHLKYRDYSLIFHPYKFDMSSINFGVGTLPKGIIAGGKDFAYMSDMSRDDSMNMSVRATGNINASGYNGTVLTNFVTDCYARDLDFFLTSDNNLTLTNTSYQIRFMDFNSTNELIYDSNATNINTSKLTMPLLQIGNGNYKKDTAGSLSTISRFNYDRNVTQTLNPITARFAQLDINCTAPAECTMQADLTAAHKAIGNRAMDFNVTYAYGRIIPRDVRVFGTTVDAIASAWYEVYNTPVLAETALPPSRNTPQWYINTLQDDLIYGDGIVTQMQTAGAASVALVPSVSGGSVAGVETYNFGPHAIGSYKAHIDTDPWLWYGVNALDYVDPVTGNTATACLTHPCFNINVVPNIGRAGSSTGVNLQSDKANKGTTPSGTKVIYDYTPATR
ncbi:DUF11 domain-containing protein [Sulfuricurvum sp.]|uniref:DUF11 domain-containing protein n=1 Tax=Sulfuricurvum sp. TaxID=2025608 RepID=UPI003BB114EB